MNDYLVAAVISVLVVVIAIGLYYLFTGILPGAKIVHAPVTEVDENQAKFIFFYTTWCPHCKKAQQPWASLKEMMKTRQYTYGGKKVVLEEVNAESDKGKAALYKIKAYPTFKLETSDKMYEMLGRPSTSSFRAFLSSSLGTEKVV
jgi:thiol-disulfide isomerase/thioredoxin